MIPTESNQEAAVYSRHIRRMAGDGRMLATHVSLFTGLFVCWQQADLKTRLTLTERR